MSATCIIYREGDPFYCKVLQRKWETSIIRQWENNPAPNRLNNSGSLGGCHGQETRWKSCPPSPSPGFDPLSNLRCSGAILLQWWVCSSLDLSLFYMAQVQHQVSASSQQTPMIRDKGSRPKVCTSTLITSGKAIPSPCSTQRGIISKERQSSILGLKGQTALYRTSE